VQGSKEVGPLMAHGFDGAVIGVSEANGNVVYSYAKCVEIIEKRDNKTPQQAANFMDNSVINNYMGPGTPIFMTEVDDIRDLQL